MREESACDLFKRNFARYSYDLLTYDLIRVSHWGANKVI